MSVNLRHGSYFYDSPAFETRYYCVNRELETSEIFSHACRDCNNVTKYMLAVYPSSVWPTHMLCANCAPVEKLEKTQSGYRA
jgi:hypothetical protein